MSFFTPVLLFFFCFSQLFAQLNFQQEEQLKKFLKKFRMEALSPIETKNTLQVELGERLFFDNILSGNRNISCSSCHHPSQGTSDGMPFSVGQGAQGLGTQRIQAAGKIIRRHSPALFNLGQPGWFRMFWDGRVQIGLKSKALLTPVAEINGTKPARADITAQIDNVLAAQVLFPMINPDEMMGTDTQNEIAAQKTPGAQWDTLTARLQNHPQYWPLFQKAFPELKETHKLNIGFVAKALANFITARFQATQTPWDHFLRGNEQALSDHQKEGALLFMGKAKCATCHQGPLLTDQAFESVGAPQIMPQSWYEPQKDDQGRFEVETLTWNKEKYRYTFRVPPLRNVALTAPYMHDGAFLSLEELVDHYDNPEKTLYLFDISNLMQKFGAVYNETLITDVRGDTREVRLQNLDSRLKGGLGLTPTEKNSLVDFLKNALTDVSWKQKLRSTFVN